MPSSLQSVDDINKLPPLVGKQLIGLARVANESLHKKRYVFTNLGEDFEGLGMMKKTTSLNVCTGCECSYTYISPFRNTWQLFILLLRVLVDFTRR